MKIQRTTCLVYGIFLIAMGIFAFAASGFDPKAKTAIMSGSMSGIMVLVSFWLLGRAEGSLLVKLGWLGSLLLPLLFTGVFTWRSSIALMEYGTESWKLYKPLVIGSMQIVSLLILGMNVRGVLGYRKSS